MANKREPLCFDGRPTHAQARNSVQLSFLREILASARKNGVRELWTSSLAVAIAKNRALLPIWQFEDRVPHKVARTIGLCGTQPRPRPQGAV